MLRWASSPRRPGSRFPPRPARSGSPRPAGLASRSAWRPTSRPPTLLRSTARLDPRADARQLGLPDQRRRPRDPSTSRSSASAGRGRPPLRRLAAARSGSGSTGTSSGRCRWRPRSADFVTLCDQDDRWHPEKLERLPGSDRRRPARLQRRQGREPGGRADPALVLDGQRNNYTNFGSLLLANSVHRGSLAVPPRAARRRAAPPAQPRQRLPRPLARAGRDGPRANRICGRAALRLRPARRRGDRARSGEQAPRTLRRHLWSGCATPAMPRRVAYYYNWHQHLHLRRGAAPALLGCDVGLDKRRTLRRLLNADQRVRGRPLAAGPQGKAALGA